MNSGFALLLVFGIGVVTGLRCMTAPAVVAWAAHLGWINLNGSPWLSWVRPGRWASLLLAPWANSLPINSQLLRPNGGRRADRQNCHWLAYWRMSRRCWWRVVLAWGADWGNRRNRRSIRRLSGSRQTGSGPSRSGCCDCRPRRPGRNWARTAAGFQILKFSGVVTSNRERAYVHFAAIRCHHHRLRTGGYTSLQRWRQPGCTLP